MDSENIEEILKNYKKSDMEDNSTVLREILEMLFKAVPPAIEDASKVEHFYELFAEDIAQTYFALSKRIPGVATSYVTLNGGFGFQLAKSIISGF